MPWPEPTDDSPLAKFERLVYAGYGWCLRCGRPWEKIKPHVTHYDETSGCFPLCEDCWTLLGCGEARIEYYGTLLNYWESLGSSVSPETRFNIQRAVANGK